MDKSPYSEKIALVTGGCGFIGFHVCLSLLKDDWKVVCVDNLNEYYDKSLKLKRLSVLNQNQYFYFEQGSIEEEGLLHKILSTFEPQLVVHLAAQAGVRYSIDNPESYVQSNLIGTFRLFDAIKNYPVKHLMLASTSSVYGLNEKIPFSEIDKADAPISFYAATKKSAELIAHSYSHLFDIPVTVFRFFTVYGPWGRPDMALFKFTELILNKKPIDVYNNGELFRDFTYIDDLIFSISNLVYKIPGMVQNDLLSGASTIETKYRVVNIGNGEPIKLLDFISCLEECLQMKALRNYLPMQAGDVYQTYADNSYLQHLIGKVPKTSLESGITKFIAWYREHYERTT